MEKKMWTIVWSEKGAKDYSCKENDFVGYEMPNALPRKKPVWAPFVAFDTTEEAETARNKNTDFKVIACKISL